MCLTKIDRKEFITEPITAWKVFTPDGDQLKSPMVGTTVPIDVWILVEHPRAQLDIFDRMLYVTTSYASGFHCFTSRSDAKQFAKAVRWTLKVKVEVRQVQIKGDLTYGFDLHPSAVVASEMMVLPKHRSWLDYVPFLGY